MVSPAMMKNGILAGYNIDSMKVRVFDGGMHSVDSKPIAFELCAKEGFKAAAPKCQAPIARTHHETGVITTPEEYTGNVIGDLNRRRGLPKGQEPVSGGACGFPGRCAPERNVRLCNGPAYDYFRPC
jgi:elongation factor G